jgi:peptidyl-prolyl cis-trans isomerase B (cyclophilin B)
MGDFLTLDGLARPAYIPAQSKQRPSLQEAQMKRIFAIAFVFVLAAAIGCTSSESDQAKSDSTDAAETEKKALDHPIRNEQHHFVTIETNFGNMTLELYRDIAPAHADSFLARARDGFYDNTIFHRVVKSFMIQGGNPRAAGKDEVKYTINDEPNDLPHKEGTLSMAKTGQPNSAKTQFFICLARNQSTEYLDGKYSGFGQLVLGLDVLHAIENVEVGPNRWMGGREVSAPLQEVKLLRAYESDPYGNPVEPPEGEEG